MLECRQIYGVDDVCWFERDEKEISLVRPDGSRRSEAGLNLEDNKGHFKCEDAFDGWKRAILFMKEFNIWDGTAFGCSMDGIMCCPDGKAGAFLFVAPQSLDRISTRILSKAKRTIISKNLLEFYSDPNLQAKVSSLILHGMVLYFNGKTLEPISMKEAVNRISQQYYPEIFPLTCRLGIKELMRELDSYWETYEEY